MTTHQTYFSHDSADAFEKERLACLGELFNAATDNRLARLPISPGWKCLEVGAGEGYVARSLAARVGEEGGVVATDINTRFLGDHGLANLEVRQHDILQDDLEAGHYDLVHCRLVLAHLPDPLFAVGRMWEALRHGGWLLIEEGDMGPFGPAESSHPRSANFLRVSRAIADAVTAAGLIDAYLGRRLRAIVEQIELVRVHHEWNVPVIRGGEQGARFFQLSSELVAERILSAGLLDQDGFADYHAAYDDRTFTFVGMANFAARGQKPLGR
ncbi:MAG TPA: methyltransferase [Pirellulales bacterium]|jgi:SAM-dependent methyltransferase|nr:methyltransferase [Pirellulales bacterium]